MSKTTMKRFFTLTALAACLSILHNAPAEALVVGWSDQTGEATPYFDFKGELPLPFNLEADASLGFMPNLGAAIRHRGPDLMVDSMINFDANLGYNIDLFQAGEGILAAGATLKPYVGYHHSFTYGWAVDYNVSSQFNGANYGVRFDIGLPLGLKGYAFAGGTYLMGGSYSPNGKSSDLITNGTNLFNSGLGASWTLPIFDAASVGVGYQNYFLPHDLRNSGSFSGVGSLVHGLNLNLRVLFFSL